MYRRSRATSRERPHDRPPTSARRWLSLLVAVVLGGCQTGLDRGDPIMVDVILSHPSPNHDARAEGKNVEFLILHYTGMIDCAAALDRLTDRHAKVSAHYLVDEAGLAWQLVAEDRRAWHAGVSSWAGLSDINSRSIGIEICNPGHEFGYVGFPAAQMETVIGLARDVLARHRIPRHHVLGHSDIAPTRRQDPGELFDWSGLAAQGVGLWPRAIPARANDHGSLIVRQRRLAEIGYEISATGRTDAQTKAVVVAFQRHFRPSLVDGEIDDETAAMLEAVWTEVGASR